MMARSRWGGTNNRERVPFPQRGVPGGCCDSWDDPDDAAELRARVAANEAALDRQAAKIAAALRREGDHRRDQERAISRTRARSKS